MTSFTKNIQYYKFCLYGFLKNLRFFDAFFLLFLLEKQLSFTQIGILYAVREIVINSTEIPSGIFADTFGRKSSLVGSFAFYMISFFIFYQAVDFWLFLGAFVLYGIADAFRSGTHKGMIMDYLKINNQYQHKIDYYGHTRACSQKGSAIAALIAGLIVYYSGNYQYIFLLSIIPYVLNMLLILSYPRELEGKRKSSSGSMYSKYTETFKAFYRVTKRPDVLRIIHSSALYSAFQKASKDYIQPLMLSVALMIPFFTDIASEKRNGLIIGILFFVVYILTSQASRFASKYDRISKRDSSYITLIYGFLIALISGTLYFYEQWVFALIAFIGIYLIENLRKPILTGALADNVPNEILTSVISAQSLWKTIITAIIALLLGVLADNYSIGIAFIVVSSLFLITTYLLRLKRDKL